MKNKSIITFLAFTGLNLGIGSILAQGAVVPVGTLEDPDNVVVNNTETPLFIELGSIPIPADEATYERDVNIFVGQSGLPMDADGMPLDPDATVEGLTTTLDDGVNNNSITGIDSWNINNGAGRNASSPEWETRKFGGLETFISTNGDGVDFIMIEQGGNDDLWVKPVFLDGTTGQYVMLAPEDGPEWANTGLVTLDGAPGSNQDIVGLGWKVEDLLDADGNNLAPDTEILGLRFNDPAQGAEGAAALDPLLLVAVIQPMGVVGVGPLVDPDNVVVNNTETPLFIELGSILVPLDGKVYVRDVDIFVGQSGLPMNADGMPLDPDATVEGLTTTLDDGVNNNSITGIDSWNINNGAGRNASSPEWETRMFGGMATFTSTNGAGVDFIMIEQGGNDDLWVKPVFLDGTTGQYAMLAPEDGPEWADTGLVTLDGAPGSNQDIVGLGWKVEDLLDADGNNLAPDTEILGLRFNDPAQGAEGAAALDPLLLVAVIISEGEPAGNWIKVTDFDDEGGLDNNIVGTKIWNVDAEIPGFVGAEADPAPWVGDEGNMALHVDHNNTATQGMETAYILLPELLEDNTVATLYFRWWMDKNGGHETAISLTDHYAEPPYNVGDNPNDTIKNGYGDHQTWWRIGGEFSIANFGYSTPNTEFYRPEDLLGPEDSGKDFLAAIPENQQYQPGVWMEMWIVFDTENDIKIEYQVQNDGVQKRNHWAIIDADSVVESVIDYMPNHRGPTDQDYNGIYMVNWSRPLPNYDTQVYLDDVWIDYTGINLTTPPHGKTRNTVEIDTTPRAVVGNIGSADITMTMAPPPDAQAGKFVQLEDGTTVGKIASIAGNVLTLEAPLSVAILGNSPLTFVDDAPFESEGGGKIVNISTRGIVGEGDKAMIGGFIIREDNQTVNILVKASELIDAGVADVLADPVLTLYHGQTVIRVNDNWEDDPAQAQLISDVWGGNPPLTPGSTSSGAVLTLGPGNWTAIVTAADGTVPGGVVLLEVYEVD